VAKKWTKQSAIEELDRLRAQLDQIEASSAFSEAHIRWLAKAKRLLAEVFGTDSDYTRSLDGFSWSHVGTALFGGPDHPDEVRDPQLGLKRLAREAYLSNVEAARGVLGAARDELADSTLDDVYKGKDSGPEASLILKVINLAEYKLRKTLRTAPNDEKQVQEAFENLLIGADVPYSRETERIEYSSKTYTPDFTVPKADLAIEVKLSKAPTREKELPAEINDDILAYKQKYGNALFIVYDLGHIRDVERFTRNFQEEEGVIVVVVKH
jgi:REase_DpnII-MboI